MDCRKPLFLVMGLLVGVAGCSQSLPSLRVTGTSKALPTEEDITHKASTYVAFGDFRSKSAQSPDHSEAQRQLYREQAKLSYLKAIEVDSRYLPAYVGLAQIQQASQDYTGAAAVYRKALELSPQEARLWFELGMCQCREKDWPGATTSMLKALEQEPNNQHFAKTAALTMARAGRFDEAFAALARLEGEARAHYDLARMLHHTNQPEQARRHANAALAADPRFEAARAFLAQLDKPLTGPDKPAARPAAPLLGKVQERPVPVKTPKKPAPAAVEPTPAVSVVVPPPEAKPTPTEQPATSAPAAPNTKHQTPEAKDLPRIITPTSHRSRPESSLPSTRIELAPPAEQKGDETPSATPGEKTETPVRMPPLPVIKLPASEG